jgi:hypothetical protein
MGDALPEPETNQPRTPLVARLIELPRQPAVSLVLLVLVLVLLSLNLWDLHLVGDGVDYQRAGTWSEMLAGFGTTTAVVVSLATVLADRRRRVAERDEERVRYATQVYAWLHPKLSGTERKWFLHFENRTGIPIYQWRVQLVDDPEHVCSNAYGPIRPLESNMELQHLLGRPHSDMPRLELLFEATEGAGAWIRESNGVTKQITSVELMCDHTSA